MHRTKPHGRPRGVARSELIVSVAALTTLASMTVPALSDVTTTSRRLSSADNLRELGAHQTCYARDHDDRQFTVAPNDIGAYDGYFDYIDEVGCVPPVQLGWSDFGPLYGFHLECEGLYAGIAGNYQAVVPIAIGWGSGSDLGAYRFPNARVMHDYGSGRFYAAEYYAPGDWNHAAVEERIVVGTEYVVSDGLIPSSYIYSGAAMYHPDVFRQPGDGGYQTPGTLIAAGAFPETFHAPRVSQVRYAALKSRLMEHHWYGAGAPASGHPAYTDSLLMPNSAEQPWLFNHARDASALALFFDGSVRRQVAGDVAGADARIRAQSNGAQTLWSRDTPWGSDGYNGAFAADATRVSHHVLTTDGILGRDRVAGANRTGGAR